MAKRIELVALVALAGCGGGSGFVNAAMPNDGVAISHVEAAERGIIAVRRSGTIRVCPEPPPDVAITDSRSFTLAVETVLQQADIDVDVRREVTEQLSQVNPTSEATTYLRSALVQVCWLAANTGLGDQEVVAMYEATLRESRAVAYRTVIVEFIRAMQVYVARDQVDTAILDRLVVALTTLILQSAPPEEREELIEFVSPT